MCPILAYEEAVLYYASFCLPFFQWAETHTPKCVADSEITSLVSLSQSIWAGCVRPSHSGGRVKQDKVNFRNAGADIARPL